MTPPDQQEHFLARSGIALVALLCLFTLPAPANLDATLGSAGSVLGAQANMHLAQDSGGNTAGNVKGFVDKIDKDSSGTYVYGWACQERVSEPINLHIYAGGPAGSGTLVTATGLTNIANEAAVSTACGTTGVKHRYKYYFSNEMLTRYAGEKIYVHGIRKVGTVANALLTNSGNFTLPVTVTPPPGSPTCTLSASPSSIASGQSATLSWTTTNATSASINNGVGAVTPTAGGTKSVSPATTTTYTMTATGAGGSATCNTSVTVTASRPTPGPSTKFSVGEGVRVNPVIKALNVLSTPGGPALGQQAGGSIGVIATPPTSQNGIKVGDNYWWYVNFDTGVDGWAAEQLIATYTPPPIEPPPIAICPATVPPPIIKAAGTQTATVAQPTGAAAEVVGETVEEAETTPGAPLNTAAIYQEQLATGKMAAPTTRVAKTGMWNNRATWGGILPTANDTVRIPQGVTVTLEGAAYAGSVEVNGILKTGSADTSLSARWVMVMGSGSRFEVGTLASPFIRTFTLELFGPKSTENIHGAGTKFLMAMGGGVIQMHGRPQVSWTKLYATAAKGATQIKVSEPVSWEIGDQIVIASSVLNPNQAEVRTITGRSTDCLTLTLDKPLTYRHVGEQTRYTRPTDNKSWVLDQRAEVGLLTHNVKVQGDASSESTGFGAHVMIMKGAKGYFSDVELYRMGQKKSMGRYPIHWHMAENTSAGQYIKNSSIYRSYNRAVTLHGSESVVIERNVAYDHMGHGIFLEEGSERFNKINYNLVMQTRKPAPGDELLPSDNELNEPQNRTPSSFWITNPNNEFIGNVAAGTVGTGFWFIFPAKPLGLSASVARFKNMSPQTQPLGTFRDNVAHSNMSGFDVHDSINPTTHQISRNKAWNPPAVSYLDNFTLYANYLSLYSGTNSKKVEKVVFRNVISADIYLEHVRFAHFETIENSLFVEDSGNGILPATANTSFYALYDGAGRVYKSHFVGFDKPGTTFIKSGGASIKQPNHLFSGLTFDPKTPPRIVFSDCSSISCESGGGNWFNVSVVDVDGSLTGKAGHTITSNNPIMLTKNSVPWSNGANAYVSPHKFKMIFLNTSAPITWKRTGGGEPTVTYTDTFVKPHKSRQLHAIDGAGFNYTY
ncbi:hypothetical protein A3F55_01215 [Candidatus Adlerbacteria bacterium RIFCSPHIGHO2_12_FULL_53_18]|uniref:G8 domain-containing protein n=1 Tax=Candidatus Adlerbacteria bacterium RIFCSPHIGHO2_12_FULL_53_18 TaxID=1797242 RepID=A0A1F4XTD8_9BACT|nr:MAG: hypothetical protein A3F55_01215 [Candidatus Adlerbacteria bacterium RIFCSPHIGHO2_12_FULL_53_18]